MSKRPTTQYHDIQQRRDNHVRHTLTQMEGFQPNRSSSETVSFASQQSSSLDSSTVVDTNNTQHHSASGGEDVSSTVFCTQTTTDSEDFNPWSVSSARRSITFNQTLTQMFPNDDGNDHPNPRRVSSESCRSVTTRQVSLDSTSATTKNHQRKAEPEPLASARQLTLTQHYDILEEEELDDSGCDLDQSEMMQLSQRYSQFANDEATPRRVSSESYREGGSRPVSLYSTSVDTANHQRQPDPESITSRQPTLTQHYDVLEEEEFDDGGCDLDQFEMTQLSQRYSQNTNEEATGFAEEHQNVEVKAAKRLKSEDTFVDTEDKVRIAIGMTWKIFKRGEIYRYRPPPRKGTLYQATRLYKILKFLPGFENGNKMAICDVIMEMKDTFIGKEESERIKKSLEDEHPYKYDFVTIAKADRRVALKIFTGDHIRHPWPDVDPDLIYDAIIEKGNSFNVAYRCHSSRQKLIPLNRKPVVLDLFAGGGGMSLGYQLEGFDVKYLVEKDEHAGATLLCNHSRDKSRVFVEGVEMFFEKMEKRTPGYPVPGEIDHIHASPPCQGYSMANRNGGKDDEKNNELTLKFLKGVRIGYPKTGLLENVTGMLRAKVDRYAKRVASELTELGYQVRVTIVDASRCGDPQIRHRVFFFASRRQYLLPGVPEPTHGSDTQHPVKTAKDALHDLEDIEPAKQSGIVVMANGQVVYNHYHEGTELSETAERQKLVAEEPARTVLRGRMIEHYNESRGVTIRERARLQSFPDTHVFTGSHVHQKNQIGNAVPIHLARACARSVMECYQINLEQK